MRRSRCASTWASSENATTEAACTAHIVKRDPNLDDDLLRRIAAGLHDNFGIEHTTVQFESCHGPDCPMESEAAHPA